MFLTKNKETMDMLQKVKKLACLQCTVLIQGESGTGKELIAKMLHGSRSGEFKPINSAALPRDLVESELFGYVKGAFTSAATPGKGLLRSSEAGTVFLDEIGDMPLEAQAKLLRVLQERKVRPVGGVEEHTLSCRFIAATNRNLEELIREGRFRPDLYYRLRGGMEIQIKPLRERREDIPVLVAHFEEKLPEEGIDVIDPIGEQVLEMWKQLPWVGNVRELEGAVRSFHVSKMMQAMSELV